MPKVTYYKPNRSHPRHFTEKDVARISKYVIRDGGSAVKVVAAVAVALGLGATFCKSAKAFQAMTRISFWIKKLAVMLAGGQLMKILIQTLLKAKVVAPPGYNVLLALLIVTLSLLDAIIEAAMEWVNNISALDDVTALVGGICQHVQELGGMVTEDISSTSWADSTLDLLRGKMSDASYALKSELEKAWFLTVETSIWDEFLNVLKAL